MKVFHLVLREIRYRRLNFLLGTLSATVATACVVGTVTVLRQLDARTEQVIAAKEAETRARMAVLEDDYRKITKGLGFNVLILPKEQNLSDLYARDFATNTMPEEYAARLARSRVATIQHLLPSLQQKMQWPEVERMVILVGVRGEVPILQADAKKPILEAVPPGTLTAGWELHRSLRLKTGDKVRLLGREFTVGALRPERGTKDDITLWINLKEAQELLNRPGQINGILALECVCAADSLDKVRAEIGRVLPDTQVIEFQSQTLARAEARRRAATEAAEAVRQEKNHRARLRQEREAFAAVLVPVVVAASAVWIALLSLNNVRQRRAEIGILRAVGTGTGRLMTLFLGRAALMGLAGAIPGWVGGWLAGRLWQEAGRTAGMAVARLDPWLGLAVLAGTPLLALLAAWLPAYLAAQQDPAQILSGE